MPRPLSHNGLVILRVKDSPPRDTYAGLLWVCRNKGFKNGWVFHKFIEIYPLLEAELWEFGRRGAIEPQAPNSDLREYLGIMRNRYRQKKKREELKNGRTILPLETPGQR